MDENNIFEDFLHIDWDGGMDAQTQFYFVSKKLDEKHLFNLYKINMLNKLCITINRTNVEF